MVVSYDFSISIVTKFEVKIGLMTEERCPAYNEIVQKIAPIPEEKSYIDKAVEIFHYLK